MKASVIGASGYSGGELLRLIAGHSGLLLDKAIAHSHAGASIASIHPQLSGLAIGGSSSDWQLPTHFAPFDIDSLVSSDLIFFALPHGESGRLISEHETFFGSKKVVDLGADFRLTSASSWEHYYGGKHYGSWQYGLPELPSAREEISQSKHVANPGCYATAIALSLLPFTSIRKSVDFIDIVITAASGTTGAGRNAKSNLLGSEVMNSLTAYKVGGVHQHTPEIEQAIEKLVVDQVRLSFTPILAPMPRGILASLSIPIEGVQIDDLHQIFSEQYRNEKFVQILPSGQMPQTNALIGSNSIQLQVAVDSHVGRAIVIAAIDNLGKGAAGQAIQNANLICGFEESTGLSIAGVR